MPMMPSGRGIFETLRVHRRWGDFSDQVFVKAIRLPEGKQPDMLSTEDLEALLR